MEQVTACLQEFEEEVHEDQEDGVGQSRAPHRRLAAVFSHACLLGDAGSDGGCNGGCRCGLGCQSCRTTDEHASLLEQQQPQQVPQQQPEPCLSSRL